MNLKPCPFCGGAPVVSSSGGDDERNGYNFISSVRCTGCGATVSEHSERDKNHWCRESTENCEARAIESWNKRVEPNETKASSSSS